MMIDIAQKEGNSQGTQKVGSTLMNNYTWGTAAEHRDLL
jgi:hypothetical protein